ncbi:polysaccharide biosynthesis protein [uncultured Enterococcus sp.]|uniref:putative polysaccharide biosynthesis protein n=1 Tax=uncultured Enterococcus sp. TaxID=167972 RepID=UPI0025D26787|nr:polysaccharide biosynthesis protein [uncultured Enterococcus sp.]
MEKYEKIQETPLSNEEQMARGSAWMTFGNIGSRLLGALYILPWYFWMGAYGKEANALFGMGYNVYALFIMISTAGIPAAIAKQIAYHNSRQEYRTSKKLFIRALQLMAVFGGFGAAVMYLFSPFLAHAAGGGDELIPTMHSLSLALLIIPMMSVIRGYFQAMHNLAPYAISQLVEQVARVFYMLLATFIIMRLGSGDYIKAVTQSTLAAFVGAVASLLVLLYYFKSEKLKMDVRAEISEEDVVLDTKSLLLTTIHESIPFIIVGSGITLFKLVDQYTFIKTIESFTNYTHNQAIGLFALFSANPDKLTMVVIGLAIALASVGLPLIAEHHASNNKVGLAKLISNNLQLYFFVMFPATFGMVLLAFPLNTIFYGPDPFGTNLLIEATLSGLVLGLFMLSASMLQGIYQNRAAVIYLVIGFVIKLVIQIPFIYWFESYGPLLATTIALAVTCVLNLYKLHQITRFNLSLTIRRIGLFFVMTLALIVVAGLARLIFGQFLAIDRKLPAFILVLLVAGIGALTYIYIALKIRIADRLLGPGMARMRARLRIK